MHTLHKAGHRHHRSHGHEHPHGHSAAPATEGRLIRAARFYDLRVSLMLLGQGRKLRALPLDLAELRAGERVLDVGCGTGDLALAAARRVGRAGAVCGIDASPEMIAVARGKARRSRGAAHFAVETVEALSFSDGSFDVVLSSLMMHHLPADLRRRALLEIRRVLRPGGRIVIVDLHAGAMLRPWQPGWILTRLHRLHAHAHAGAQAPGSTLAALLREASFAEVDNGPTRYPWLAYARGRVPA